MTPLQQQRAALAATVIQGLEKRGMSGRYCASAEEALNAVKEDFLAQGRKVSWGGSHTLEQLGLAEAAKQAGCQILDRHCAADPKEAEEIYKEILFCDTYFMSSNAITQDGILVNIDGNGNRIAALTFGPKQVVLLVGMNKVAPDLDSAIKRARNYAAPPNCVRLGINTPCVHTGRCHDCASPDSICCQFLITRRSRHPNRIHVILVGEDLGF